MRLLPSIKPWLLASDSIKAAASSSRGAVIAGLGAKNGGFNGTFIADTMATAKHLDQSMLHTVDFGYRQEVRHLFGETLQQVMVASNRLLKGIHHLGTHQLLGWDHVVQIEP